MQGLSRCEQLVGRAEANATRWCFPAVLFLQGVGVCADGMASVQLHPCRGCSFEPTVTLWSSMLSVAYSRTPCATPHHGSAPNRHEQSSAASAHTHIFIQHTHTHTHTHNTRARHAERACHKCLKQQARDEPTQLARSVRQMAIAHDPAALPAA